MGVFFKIRSPALIEDVYIPEEAEEDPAHFIDALEKGYAQAGHPFCDPYPTDAAPAG